MHSFDAATAVRPRPDGSVFDVDVDPVWTVGDKPNGGYLMALLGRAARVSVAGDGGLSWEVVSASTTYLRAPALGPALVRTEVLRRGRTAAHVRAVLVQEDDDLVDAVFVLGELAPAAAVRYSNVRPMEIPPPEECVRLTPQLPGGTPAGILSVTDLRFDPSLQLFGPSTGAETSGRTAPAELRGWTRFDDGRESDALSLLYFADACPPATFPIGSSGWVPTLQMSVYVRGLPAPGWLAIRMEANVVVAGTVDETCTVWDAQGHVVAQAHQLARVRFPDDAG